MAENKGKPSKQVPDERKEREVETRATTAPRTTHRSNARRSMEKGGKGDAAERRAAR